MTAAPEYLPMAVEIAHRYVEVRGCRFHVAEAGEGPAVVLLHGWPQHWWMWRQAIGPLAEHHRVICPDLRGLGWSEAPRRGYRRVDMARDLLGLLDELGIARTHLVAHDWGLFPAYWLSLFWPWRVNRFAALSGPHIWAAEGTPPLAFLRLWHFAILASPLGPLAVRRLGLARHALKSWRHRGTFDEFELDAYLERVTRPASSRATARRYRHNITDFLWFALNASSVGLSVPTLNLVGEHDRLANASGPNRLTESNARDFRYELVPDAGHFLIEERSDWVIPRILAFLEEASGATGVADHEALPEEPA
jgi:pimeloyl-ACP methyl ester carboxylesterase